MTEKKILLVDMDGVKADYYKGFCIEWAKRFPDRPIVPASELKTFYLENAYPKEWEQDILAITRGKGFFLNLPLIEGAAEALKEMDECGKFEVYLCTAPDVDAEDQCCPGEKLQWIEKHLGKKWLKRTIMSTDKSLIHGHYIIDDKPVMKQSVGPMWKRIFFTHAYNKDLPGPRINKWSEWRKVLLPDLPWAV
jgi:5'-nucleotidase